jgi:murein DD-endopeptidase MepM/ murein hydrolase activator NlpD
MARRRGNNSIAIALAFIAGAVCMLLIVTASRLRAPASANHSPNAAVPVEARGKAPPAPVISPVEPEVRPDVGHDRPPSRPPPEPAAGSIAELRSRGLLIPLAGITTASLRSSFTEARAGGRAHEAIDMLAPRDTPVRAVENGVIAKLFESKAGGTTIYQFDPTGRYAYYYAHLEEYARGLQEGAAVKRGQTIGYVGTSGNAPPNTPHLHFAIFRLTDDKRWWEGDPIDPYAVWKD